MEIKTLKDGFEIHLACDAELRTIIESLKFLLNTLEKNSDR